MEYKSPLQDAYGESDDLGKIHSQKKEKYCPYSKKNPSDMQLVKFDSNTQNTDTTSHYLDRFKLPIYPKELKDMFHVTECKLCSAELTSSVVLKCHYSGKPHLKRVKHFLTEYNLKRGLPVPLVVPTSEEPANEEECTLPHCCDLCLVSLPTINARKLHFSGRLHRKNMRHPENAIMKQNKCETIDPSGRFGIGTDFLDHSEDKVVPKEHQLYVCNLCNVTEGLEDQFKKHLSGKRHKKKVATLKLQDPKQVAELLLKYKGLFD